MYVFAPLFPTFDYISLISPRFCVGPDGNEVPVWTQVALTQTQSPRVFAATTDAPNGDEVQIIPVSETSAPSSDHGGKESQGRENCHFHAGVEYVPTKNKPNKPPWLTIAGIAWARANLKAQHHPPVDEEIGTTTCLCGLDLCSPFLPPAPSPFLDQCCGLDFLIRV